MWATPACTVTLGALRQLTSVSQPRKRELVPARAMSRTCVPAGKNALLHLPVVEVRVNVQVIPGGWEVTVPSPHGPTQPRARDTLPLPAENSDVTVRTEPTRPPPASATMTDDWLLVVGVVSTVNVLVLAPAGTVTVDGTVATAVLSLLRKTVAPPEGAADARRTVPVTGVPPTTELWLRVTLLTAGPVAAGVTARVKARVAVPFVARMRADWLVVTGDVVTVNDAVLAPCATVTAAGTPAIALSLFNATVMPLPVAGAVRVTVPVAEAPPATDSGEMLRFDSVGFADVTVKRAVLLAPAALAVMTEELVPVVVPETTVNDAAVAPDATVTFAGTVPADALPLVSDTTTPPVGAAPVRVTVPVLFDPSTTVSGFTLKPVSVGLDEAAGATVSTAERVTAPAVAEIVTELVWITDVVATVKVDLVEPLGTVTRAGTDATAPLLLVRSTLWPPEGALADRLTLPVTDAPPVALVGLRTTLDGVGADGVVVVQPDSRAFAGVADPSLTSTVQSAGGVKLRSMRKAPEPSLVPMETPSTVMVRFATPRPSSRSWPLLVSARETVTAALAAGAVPATRTSPSSSTAAAFRGYGRLLMTTTSFSSGLSEPPRGNGTFGHSPMDLGAVRLNPAYRAGPGGSR